MVEMEGPSVNYPLPSGGPLVIFPNAEIIWSSDQETTTNEDLVLSMAISGYYSNVTQYPEKAALNNELDNAPASYRVMLLNLHLVVTTTCVQEIKTSAIVNKKENFLVRGLLFTFVSSHVFTHSALFHTFYCTLNLLNYFKYTRYQ